MDLWRQHWRLDRAVAREGSASLRLDNTADLPLLRAHSVWVSPPTSAGQCVLSAWLKADREKLPVVLSCGGHTVTAQAGLQWSQAALKGIVPGENLLVVIAPQVPGTLWVDAVQLQPGEEPTPEFHPCAADEAIAAAEQLVDWSPPRRTADITGGRAIQGPVRPARAETDPHGRFLLDGRPYLQHSLGLEFVSDPDILDFAAASGFRDVCVQIRETLTTDQLRGICDRCAQVGLRIIPWLDGRIPHERFADHLRALRDHPAVLCWYVYDEPSGDRFAEADARVKLAKELDPARPAYINYLSDKLENQTGDIYSTDVYPIPHGVPIHAINAVQRMQAAAAPEHKPVWIWLQGTGYAYWMDREPSPRELSCMAYGSLIAGARGIYYFAQIPRTKQCFDEMRALCVETDALTPALCSLEAAPEVSCDQPAVLCRAFSQGGSLWVLAVNMQRAACTARLKLPKATGPVEVVFEGRRLDASRNAWQDAFGQYERHVYRLTAPK
jgi:hypothetical protein